MVVVRAPSKAQDGHAGYLVVVTLQAVVKVEVEVVVVVVGVG